MTKADLVSKVALETGFPKNDIAVMIDATMASIESSMAEGENVYLRGFGSFIVKTRSQKTARNISKNTTIIIPEHNIPAFKPAKVFME